jgi:hypothetical protein
MDISRLPQWPGDPNKWEPPDKDVQSKEWVIGGVLLFLCAIAILALFFWLLQPPPVLPM